MKIKFKPNNNIPYMQDFRFFKNIPDNIWFDVKFNNNGYNLTANGYGVIGNYGNGSLHVWLSEKKA